jgi:hypothetical protein
MAKKFKKSGPKDPFAALPESFKDAMTAAGSDELNKQLGAIAKAEEHNKAAMKADKDLKEKRAQVMEASKVYRENTKLNDLKTKYITRQLADKGDSLSSETVRLSLDAK